MRRWITLALLAASVTFAAPLVNRASLEPLEHRFDQRIESFDISDPFYLLGNTRGVYLESYGAVFTAELNLVAGTATSPFMPKYTEVQKEQLRAKKQQRLPGLKKLMRDMMVDSALALDTIPPEQQIAVGVSLFYYSWENRGGLPAQIVMQAKRQSMVDFEAGRITPAQLDEAIRVREE